MVFTGLAPFVHRWDAKVPPVEEIDRVNDRFAAP